MDTSWRRNYLRYKSFFLNMMTQYRERSDWKAYLEILLSLGTVSVFSIFALRPTILTIAELIQQIEEKKTTVAKMDNKISSLIKAQSLYDRESGNIALLTTTAIPNKAIADIFSLQVEGLSKKHSVNLYRITLGQSVIAGKELVQEAVAAPKEGEPVDDTKKYDFTVTATATLKQYNQISGFIKDFENLRTIAKVEAVSVSAKEEEEGKEKELTVLIEGKMPYLMQVNPK